MFLVGYIVHFKGDYFKVFDRHAIKAVYPSF